MARPTPTSHQICARPAGPDRRQWLLGAAAAAAGVVALPRRGWSAKPKRLKLATWPAYHDPENFKRFEAMTGIAVEAQVFGSNEEMMTLLLGGRSGFDVVVATNYVIHTYASLGLIRYLDPPQLPSYDESAQEQRFLWPSKVLGGIYGVPKNWGTTGFVYDSRKIAGNPTRWQDFWDLARGPASKATVVHDYQLTTIGNALKYFGYSFNSTAPVELAKARQLLLDVKPHLRRITSEGAEEMRRGAALSMAWTGDGLNLSRENPAFKYVIAEEGGELWCDYYTVPAETTQVADAYALINFLLTPEVNAREVQAHGFPTPDRRTAALLPPEITKNPIVFPPESALKALEFGAAETLADQTRARILAELKV